MSKFIVVPFDLLDSTSGKMVILSDYKYWADHQDELEAWCKEYGAEFQGMTVTLDEPTLITFCLKWA